MSSKSDIEATQKVAMQPASEATARLEMGRETLEPYGHYKAKIDIHALKSVPHKAKLASVIAISPTPTGKGKTTTSVGLTDVLSRLGKKATLCLCEPSLGPVFGVKGGAAGGNYAQIIPMEDTNLRFTGDFHAVSVANNLMSILIDNRTQQGNELSIGPHETVWKCALDMNDRQLRHIVYDLGGRTDDVPREDGFDVTVVSETTAMLCLSTNLDDLKAHPSRMTVAFTRDNGPVTAHDLHAEGVMAALSKDTVEPNLVQTLEHVPALIHGGPFANIAHGYNSVMATGTAVKLGDYVMAEASFGADLGAEKSVNIERRAPDLEPSTAVIATTVRALKRHGGVAKAGPSTENLEALKEGLPNLLQHVENVTRAYGLPCVVAISAFPTDTAIELSLVEEQCRVLNVNVALSKVWAKGDEGGRALAKEVLHFYERPNRFQYVYDADDSIEDKLDAITAKVYRADGVDFTPAARKQFKQFMGPGFDKLPIYVTKTQSSFSDDAVLSGAPRSFCITVCSLRVAAGVGFLVTPTGSIMIIPGLPKVPSANEIDIDSEGRITGLF